MKNSDTEKNQIKTEKKKRKKSKTQLYHNDEAGKEFVRKDASRGEHFGCDHTMQRRSRFSEIAVNIFI